MSEKLAKRVKHDEITISNSKNGPEELHGPTDQVLEKVIWALGRAGRAAFWVIFLGSDGVYSVVRIPPKSTMSFASPRRAAINWAR
jgi:hypothetical protein